MCVCVGERGGGGWLSLVYSTIYKCTIYALNVNIPVFIIARISGECELCVCVRVLALLSSVYVGLACMSVACTMLVSVAQ